MKDRFAEDRKLMIENLKLEGISDKKILEAFQKVPREQFAPPKFRKLCFYQPVPIPPARLNLVMSEPIVHAKQLLGLDLEEGNKVLEIGFGSGILLAYIAELVGKNGEVYGIEVVKETFEFGKKNLQRTDYAKHVKIFNADGSKGLPQFAPYDRIVSSAWVYEVPKEWIEQVRDEGIIVAPIGVHHAYQDLVAIKKTKKGLTRKSLGGVVFVELQK
jgi:protein-L-isoaspartate(D-aspartate) O-methyltransferase